METRTEEKRSLEQLSYLPSFAAYLLEERLEDFLSFQYKMSEKLNIPLLKYFKDLPKEQFIEMSRKGAIEFLSYLAENEAGDQIENSVKRWRENQLPMVNRNDIAAEDITNITYLRKKTFLHFIPGYCNGIEQIIQLVSEIDLFLMVSETALTNTYIDILKEKISEDSLLIEKVNDTIPGALYVFNVENFEGIYSNKKLADIIGYTQEELNGMGENAISQLVHPADREYFIQHINRIKKAGDGESFVYKYRVKDKNGEYKWLSNYESVFKRNDQGEVCQTIGITLDVDKEQQVAQALVENEKLHQRAEAITHLGSYTWDLKTNHLKWSDELCRIYGLDPEKDKIEFSKISDFNHPDDTPIVRQATSRAIATGQSFDFHYRILLRDGTEKILHARGDVILDDQGKAQSVLGTVLDVTEKQGLIHRLEQNESIYKQAERLANIGNWSWDIKKNKLEWTDHLYRIYDLEPQSEDVTIDRFLSFVHPDDREYIKTGIEKTFEQTLLDYTFRIITAKGDIKILRSVAQVQRDGTGQPVFVIGTERDITEKQTLIDKLQESEKLFNQAQSLAHLGNWTLDVKTKQFSWSDEMFKIYEIEKTDSLSFEEWLTYLSPDEREDAVESYEECLREKKLYDKVHAIILRNGKVKTIHRKGEFLFDENGNPVKMVGTTQDVTEEYRTQQELKENQTFIRKITDATPSIIASYNINTGQYVFISEGLGKLLGYETGEVMDKGVAFFAGIVHPEDIAIIMEKNAKALEEANADVYMNDMVVEFNYRMRHKNGSYRWFHTYGTIFDRNKEGRVEHVLNISLDVTDQMEALQKIKEQEHFIQQIADASPTILYLYDVKKQGIVYINREIFFVLGYSPEHIVDAGEKITSMLYHPEDYHLLPARKESQKTFQQIDSMIQYECRIKSNDGEWRWFLVREIVFKTDEEGNISQILGAALDINRRKEMERTILQNTLLLEQSNASLEEFAYVASHDLKEPLRKISTFGDRLVATHVNDLSPDGKIYLQKIVDASQRMQIMINDLLSISMITGNTAFENCSLQKILEETLQTLEYKIEQQNVIIRSDGLPEANIIPSQFRQLFQNLLSNSLKFLRQGVQPEIHISHSFINAGDMRHYQLAHAEQYLRIEFTDNGIGFENEFAGKIFAIFQRLHGRSEYEGSGIGLAICKKIVEHHGGIIYASGSLDVGATFTIILPA